MIEYRTQNFEQLKPISLEYIKKDVSLNVENVFYKNGLAITKNSVFKNYKDVSLNNGSVLVLSDNISISDIVAEELPKELGIIPTLITLHINDAVSSGLKYINKKFYASQEADLLVVVKSETLEECVNIIYDNKFVVVDTKYPYIVSLVERDDLSIIKSNFYNFFIERIYDNVVTIKIKLDDSFRFLSINKDNILQACGVVLGMTEPQPYLFTYKSYSKEEISTTIQDNKWVTYFMDISQRNHNSDVEINKEFNAPCNVLCSFNIEDATVKNNTELNLLNLKTNFTPQGGGVVVSNFYNEIETAVTENISARAILNTTNGILYI